MQPDSADAAASLEWPPPGLDAIHGRVRRLAARGWIATALMCPLLLWLLADAPGLDPQRGGSAIIAWIAFIGIAAFLFAIAGAAGLLDQVRRARRLGYSARIALDVATDTGRGVAAWRATGTRAVTRDRTRALRRTGTLLTAVASVLPPPLLALGLVLALRGAASLSGVIAIAVLPPLFALLSAALMRGYALLLEQWDRGSTQWDPEPVTVEDRARAWLAAAAPDAARRAPGLRHTLGVIAASMVVIGVFVFTVLTTVAALTVGVSARALEPWLTRLNSSVPGDLLVSLARAERLPKPADTTLDALSAGVLLHHALYGGIERRPGMHDVPDDMDTPWAIAWNGPWVNATDLWSRVVRDSVDAQQLADGNHPAVAAALRAARAFDADIFGARWRADAPIELQEVALPRPNNTRRLMHAITTRAAQAARAGRYDQADHELRALISLGALLMDNSPVSSDYSSGAAMARQGHVLLGRLRSMRGDSTLHNLFRMLNQHGASGNRRTIETGESLQGVVRIAAGETTGPPSTRWQAALALQLAAHCGSLRGILFGPPPRPPQLEQMLRRSLVRFPSEQRLYDIIHEPDAHRAALPRVPLPRRWEAAPVIQAILGERHARSICYAGRWF
jgi:hypothetical protein